jgi:nucleotide-binding universal stress UspA family protein
VEYVRGLQRQFEANVYVVHVLDLFPYSLSSESGAAAKAENIRRTGNLRTEEFVQKHELKGDKFASVLLSGEVSSAVEQFAREHEIDLIVLGTRGAEGINRVFQGSMAEEIFRSSQCAVMVIGPHAGKAGSSGIFNHLFFPTDLSSYSKAALPYIEFLLAQNSLVKVSLAHFLEQDPGTPYQRHRARQRAEQELTTLISPALRNRIQDVVVEFCPPVEGIVEMTHGVGADMLVLGVRQGGSFVRAATHGLRSVTHHVTTQAPCPVLTVRGLQ